MKVCKKVESKGRTTYNEGVLQPFCTATTSLVIYQLMQVSNALAMTDTMLNNTMRAFYKNLTSLQRVVDNMDKNCTISEYYPELTEKMLMIKPLVISRLVK